MAVGDRERWDVRHRAVGDASGPVVPMPPDVVRGREDLVPGRGRALEIACGRGAVAVWLAGRGLAVDAVDVSEAGLAAGRALAAHEGVSDRLRWWVHDLDAGLPRGCGGPYDVVVCQRFRDPALYPVLAGVLAPGGLLLMTVLSEVEDAPGPFRAHPGELLAAFPALEVVHHREGSGEAALIARRVRAS